MGNEDKRKGLRNKEQPFLDKILLGLTAGLIVGLLTIILEISLASLLFSGDLSGFLTRGIGFLLFGSVIVLVIASLTSRFAGVIVTPEDTPVVLLTLVVTGISVNMPETSTPDDLFITVVASIVITSVLVGLVFLFMGTFRFGKLIRFIPAPVIGGFLSGIGWLLLVGSLEVMTDTSLGSGNISILFHPTIIAKWVPGSVFAVILVVAMRRFRHFLLMPAMIVSAIGLFFLFLWLTGSTLDEAGSRGWLLGPFPQEKLWKFISFSDFGNVQWNIIWGQLVNLGIIALVSTFSLLLNISGLELITHRDIDLNHELKVAGFANIISGFVGSPPSYHTLSYSALGERMGAKTRSVGLFAAALCGLVLILGTSLLSYFPKPVLGGLLIFLGASFLVEWLYDGWFRLSKIDYALVVIILFSVCTIGFMEGVGVGIIIAVVLFITNYSRISVIRQTLTGTTLRSNVDRPADEREHLREWGDQLHVLKLQGFIFFGTAHSLFQEVKERIDDKDLPALRFIVFDFRRVIGLDGSAEISFIKIIYLAHENDIELVFTDISDHFRSQIQRATTQILESVKMGFFADLDHGIEWCEEQMLTQSKVKVSEKFHTLQNILQPIFGDMSLIERMMTYLEKEKTDNDTVVVRQGEAAQHLFIIESGEFVVQLELPDKEPVRLRTMRAGTVFGEIGMYLNIPRSVTVISTGSGSFYKLSSDSLKEMERKDPDLALKFQNYVIHILSERLVDLNRTLESILD
jgi:SulP family sulfate permease